jgi:hypothetical protein
VTGRAIEIDSSACDYDRVSRPPWPDHHSDLGCTDYVAGVDIGELAPGHRLVVRGVCVDGPRLWFYYAWMPGLSRLMGEDSGLWLSVEYGADVLPDDLNCAGSYDTGGGDTSDGEICYASPPPHARRVWFDFCTTTDGDHPVCRLTIDLVTGQIQVERAVAGEGSD